MIAWNLKQIVGKNCSKKLNIDYRKRKTAAYRANHRGKNNERDKHNTKSSVSYQRIWTCAVFEKTSMNVSSVICFEIFPFSLFRICVYLAQQCRLKFCTMISIVNLYIITMLLFFDWVFVFFTPCQQWRMLVAVFYYTMKE